MPETLSTAQIFWEESAPGRFKMWLEKLLSLLLYAPLLLPVILLFFSALLSSKHRESDSSGSHWGNDDDYRFNAGRTDRMAVFT